MKILALDQSVKATGWALLDHQRGFPPRILHSGFFGAKALNTDETVKLFSSNAAELISDYAPHYMVWEKPTQFMARPGGVTARTLILTRLDQSLKEQCAFRLLPYDTVAANTWRSKILGKGAGKLPRDQAKTRALAYAHMLGVEVRSADQAEAICIGLWACAFGPALIELERAA